MQFYGKLINGVVEYAPKNYITDDGKTILNLDKNPKLLNKLGYKLIVDKSTPDYDPSYQDISSEWIEEDTQIVKLWTITDNIQKLATNVLEQIETWCNSKLEEFVQVDDYYVKGSWFSTYSNVFQALKFAEDNNLQIEPSDVIVATKNGIFLNIPISSSNELKPLYQAVMYKYQEIIPQRNRFLIEAQESTTVDELKELLERLF